MKDASDLRSCAISNLEANSTPVSFQNRITVLLTCEALLLTCSALTVEQEMQSY